MTTTSTGTPTGVFSDWLPAPEEPRWLRLQALIELDAFEQRTSAEIAQRIEERTSFAPSSSSVGQALRKLGEQGWVERLTDGHWRITSRGVRVVVLFLREQ